MEPTHNDELSIVRTTPTPLESVTINASIMRVYNSEGIKLTDSIGGRYQQAHLSSGNYKIQIECNLPAVFAQPEFEIDLTTAKIYEAQCIPEYGTDIFGRKSLSSFKVDVKEVSVNGEE
jgi:hypothetical protein